MCMLLEYFEKFKYIRLGSVGFWKSNYKSILIILRIFFVNKDTDFIQGPNKFNPF